MRKYWGADSINQLTGHLGRVYAARAVRVEIDGEFQIDHRAWGTATNQIGWGKPGAIVGVVIVHAADRGRSTREDTDSGRNRIRRFGCAGVREVDSLGG